MSLNYQPTESYAGNGNAMPVMAFPKGDWYVFKLPTYRSYAGNGMPERGTGMSLNQGVQPNLRKKSRRVGILKKSRNQVGGVQKK